jgi:lysophospholipase L1-like esterase
MFGRAATAIALTVAAVVGPGPFGASVSGAASLEYVALGDSYTAAPLVPPNAPGPAVCARSGGNYPHLLAARFGWSLTDVSCAGAKTADLTTARAADIPPQVAALSPLSGVVTVGIGGNDHNLFASVVAGCGSRAPLALLGSTTPCRDAYATTFAHDIAADAAVVRAGLRAIHRAAPNAAVLVVGYPSLLPRDTLGRAGCPLGGVLFTPGDMDFLDHVEQSLNAMLAAAARATGSTFVDTYTPSLGHDMCRLPGIRWIEPLFPLSPAAPAHPNAAGEAATARAVARHLQ